MDKYHSSQAESLSLEGGTGEGSLPSLAGVAGQPVVHVAAAVIQDSGGRYLCMQRCRSDKEYNSEKWEFPGGKIEDGESGYDTLLREIREEMDWDVFVGRRLGTVEHKYPDFTIVLTAYLCRGGWEAFKLLEHLDYKWLTFSEMKALEWAEADKRLIDEVLTASMKQPE